MPEKPYTPEERETARQILRYLESHPDAKDTLDGIAQWWLGSDGSARNRREVERAVALLLFQAFLLETRRPGLPPYYGINPEHLGKRSP